jgi:hypothetical protein
MPLFSKQKSKLHLQLTNSDRASAHGGQVLVDALCRRFDLWQRLQREPSLDPRQRQSVGFTPAAHVAQLIFALTSGGAWLADAERIGHDRVLMNLLGLKKGADQTTLGEWLRGPEQGKRAGLAPDQRGVGGLGQRPGAARPLAARRPGGSVF